MKSSRIVCHRVLIVLITLLTYCLTVDPVIADTESWLWESGDCGGSLGAFLSAKTLNTEPDTTVCVTLQVIN